MIPYLAQPRYPLNSQVLAIFFLSATTPATPHYPEFTDRYSPQYGRLSFSLHFMIHTPFYFPSPTSTSSQPQGCPRPMHTTIPDPTDRFSMGLLPPSLSHSPDLGCVGAQRIMFLGRFLVQPTHLLSGGPRLERMWLILDLARNRCLDSENQGTIDNSL